jgi:hypothetical protein
VVQACYSSYLGGQDWKDHSSRTARGGSLRGPISTYWLAWWCASVTPGYVEGWDQEDCGKKWDPISKITSTKRAGRVAQVVEHLPTKSRFPLNSTFSATKKKIEMETIIRELLFILCALNMNIKCEYKFMTPLFWTTVKLIKPNEHSSKRSLDRVTQMSLWSSHCYRCFGIEELIECGQKSTRFSNIDLASTYLSATYWLCNVCARSPYIKCS